MAAERWLYAGLLWALLSACHGSARHPEPGQPNTPEYCAALDPDEAGCKACVSKPGCGWCDQPAAAYPSCQPGASASAPSSCGGGWHFAIDACPAPPPPPPR